jgi:hypothetical protein
VADPTKIYKVPTKTVRPNNNDAEFNLGGHFWWGTLCSSGQCKRSRKPQPPAAREPPNGELGYNYQAHVWISVVEYDNFNSLGKLCPNPDPRLKGLDNRRSVIFENSA